MKTRKNFPFATTSITQARHFVARTLGDVPDETMQPLLLIVSELATNSIRHAHTGFSVEIEFDDQAIRIAVTDKGGGQPQLKSPPPTQPSGRGLKFVDLLSHDWGVIGSTTTRGKTVWFTMNTSDQEDSYQSAR